jgi:hypothetical protein
MIDVDEIFKETRLLAKDLNIGKELDKITCNEAAIGMSNMILEASKIDPIIGLLCVTTPTLKILLQSTAAFMFEAGRNYGRAEIIEETIESIK